MDKKNFLEPSYSRITPYFKFVSRMFESKTRPKSLELANLRDGSSLLIIAPPTESYIIKLLKLNKKGKNHLLYFSEQMGSKAEEKLKKKNSQNFTIDICSDEKLPFNENFFDHVFAYCYFDFLDLKGVELAVKEINRIMKPGGNLLATYFSTPKNRAEKLSISLSSKIYFLKDIHVVEVEPILQDNNFRKIKTLHYSQKFAPVDLIYAEK